MRMKRRIVRVRSEEGERKKNKIYEEDEERKRAV